jgi:uncharacterized membrane protein
LKTLTTEEKTKNIILEEVAKEKPENTEKLKKIMSQKYNVNPLLTTLLLTELEKEDKLHFKKFETTILTSAKGYFFSQKIVWYWRIIILLIVTVISVFIIPDGAYPITYIRIILGGILLFFLPGYAAIKALFPTAVHFKTDAQNLDTIERIALSLGLNLAIVPILGLILNYTPWGIRLTPLILGLLALTIFFSTVAVLREYQARTQAFKVSE